MPYASLLNSLGTLPIEGGLTPVPSAAAPLPMTPGLMVVAVDSIYGFGEFIYARASAGIRQFGLCTFLPVWDAVATVYTYNAVEATVTANLSRMVGVSQSVLTTGQFGWFQVSGIGPVSVNASVAAGTAFGIGAAGQGGAVVAGRGVLGSVSIGASAFNVVRTATGINGSNQIFLNTAGMFLGMALTGTGVGAGVITAIDPLGTWILNSVVNTAAIAGNVTATATGFIVAHMSRPSLTQITV